MFSFFENISRAIVAAVASMAIYLGLMSAPAQPQTPIVAEPVSVTQNQSTTTDEFIDINLQANTPKKQIEEVATQTSKSHATPNIQVPSISVAEEIPQPKAQTQQPATQDIFINTQSKIIIPEVQIEIISAKVTPSSGSASFEWETNIPTNAKVFVSGSNITTLVAQSNSGFSTHHIATIPLLQANTQYAFEIEATAETMVEKHTGSFHTISLAKIEAVSPIPIKGLGREYLARPEVKDEYNYVYFGVIVYNDSGVPIRDAVVEITATDSDQDTVLNGTGDVMKTYTNGQSQNTYYYGFNYEFKTPGEHQIMYSVPALGLSVSKNFSVSLDEREQ